MSTQTPAIRIPDSAASNSIYTRVVWRFMPLLFVCYVVAYLDRVNVGFAKLQMLSDLNFSEAMYGFGAGIFFVGYFFFEVPSNLLLHRLGARRWIARIMLTWAVLSAATAWVTTPTMFYVLRFFLGVAEAGFFPGLVLYLTYWFPAHRRGKMVAFLMAGNPVAGIVGGPISGFIMQRLAGNAGLAGWQWLFILEAVPALILAAVIFWFLDDRVKDAKWLPVQDRDFIAAEIDAEARTKSHGSVRDGLHVAQGLDFVRDSLRYRDGLLCGWLLATDHHQGFGHHGCLHDWPAYCRALSCRPDHDDRSRPPC